MVDDAIDDVRHADGGERRLNLLQLLALSLLIGFAAGAMARLSGSGWGGALFLGWAGTISGALGVTALLCLTDSFLAVTRARSGAPFGADTLSALIEAWEDDLSRDRAAGLAHSEASGTGEERRQDHEPTPLRRDQGRAGGRQGSV